ncbi:hypothetical protein WFJ45_22695, partial [Salmonella enterica subsp. enterica serovar Minnesota]|uniref:hypothetical protein n=1 Tax=Salmonella enterica TaxID=28901 RepID=UPI003D26DA46
SALPPSILLPVKVGSVGDNLGDKAQTAAYLGAAYEPFVLNSDPAKSDFKVANLAPQAGQTEFRINSRKK